MPPPVPQGSARYMWRGGHGDGKDAWPAPPTSLIGGAGPGLTRVATPSEVGRGGFARDLWRGVTEHPTTILLVEDDLGLRTFLADNLTADGFDVLAADTVHDAVRLLEYKQPDLALVDVGLPDGSGLDLIARVRSADGLASRLDPQLPLVVLTGRASELDRVRGFDRGVDDFIGKPFSYGELLGRLRAILRRTRPRQALGRLRVGE